MHNAEILRTVTSIGVYYPALVKEFIVNLSSSFDVPDDAEFKKVFVRGHCFEISPGVINEFLGRGKIITADRVPSLDIIAQEITGDETKVWPSKGTLPSSDLTAKYFILYRIGIANCAPSSHGSSIKADLARLIYQIGTRSSFDFGEFVLDHLAKHAKSFAVKLPIGFPSIITGILLKQNKNILRSTDVAGKRPGVLDFNHKLFEGKHARDLVRPSIATSFATGSTLKMGHLSEAMQSNLLKGLYDEIDALKEIIETSSRMKYICERLVKEMTSSL